MHARCIKPVSISLKKRTPGSRKMKKVAVLLAVIFVTVGSAEARISSSRTFAHFPDLH